MWAIISAWVQFFRLPNLAIVFLSLAVPYWGVLRPAIVRSGGIAVLTVRSFVLLAAATLLTTLAGYVINDYFDRQIDAINKPNRLLIGRYLPPIGALGFYWALQAGIALVSLQLHREMPAPHGFWALWFFPAVSFFLFIYAWQIKCTPILGNILVALLCAVVPVMLLAPEDRPIWLASFRSPDGIQSALSLMWTYALFAFLLNLFREQVKDIEDMAGDAQCRCHTLPVLKGRRFAQKFAFLSGLACTALLVGLLYHWYEIQAPQWRLLTAAALMLAPMFTATTMMIFGKTRRQFKYASWMIKLAMPSGLFLLLP